MNTYAIINDGIVTNVVVASEPLAANWFLAPGGVGIGWLYDGQKFSPQKEPPPQPDPSPAPQQCTRRQGRLALLSHGHLDDVEAAIEAIEDPTEQRAARIEYEADTWERSNPVVQQMWQQLGGTPEQLDDLFRLAVTL